MPMQLMPNSRQCSTSFSKGVVQGGRYQVQISALTKTGRFTRNIMQPGGPPVEITENYIPAKYNSDSTLTAIISADSTKNTFDFPLQSK